MLPSTKQKLLTTCCCILVLSCFVRLQNESRIFSSVAGGLGDNASSSGASGASGASDASGSGASIALIDSTLPVNDHVNDDDKSVNGEEKEHPGIMPTTTTTPKASPVASTNLPVTANTTTPSSQSESSGGYYLPPNTTGAFLHLGKTGGTTLCQVLRNCCHSWLHKPCKNSTQLLPSHEHLLSKTSTYFHAPDFIFRNLYKNNLKYSYQ